MNPLIIDHYSRATIYWWRSAFILVALACLCVAPVTQAVSPPPDGGYPGGNTAEGQNALLGLTTGGYNTAIGFSSLRTNTTGSFNTSIGAGTLFANTAAENTAVGAGALLSNNTGESNTAVGAFALVSNTTAASNTAVGQGALQANTTGDGNTAVGRFALFSNTTTSSNTAVGQGALQSNQVGLDNTAVGRFALLGTTGSGNTAIGQGAGQNIEANNNNICIGWHVFGLAGENNTIRVGDNLPNGSACYIGGIFGELVVGGDTVICNSAGKVGTGTSSKRFKEAIKPMDNASEAILALTPVTYRYKKELDPTGTWQFGLVAEDVERVNPDLVVHDKDGQPHSVRYDQINAMLLNEFLKEHKKVEAQHGKIEKQHATIAELRSTVAQQQKDFQATIARLTTRLDEQAAQIQKVSAKLEVNKPALAIVQKTNQ